MGYADQEKGIFLFNPMDHPEPVREMVEWGVSQTGEDALPLPQSLSRRIEARLKPSVIDQIPFDPRN